MELVRLAESDLARHEAALNEHHRTALTIRGFAMTAVAALIAVGYASETLLPEIVAFFAACVFLWVDYYYDRLASDLRQRFPVLISLSVTYRRLRVKANRTDPEIDNFRGDLRSYATGPLFPAESPRLVRRVPLKDLGRLGARLPAGLGAKRVPLLLPLGRLRVFLSIYLLLIVAALASAWYIADHDSIYARGELVCANRVGGLSILTTSTVHELKFRCPK
jgi:hypothetical protein